MVVMSLQTYERLSEAGPTQAPKPASRPMSEPTVTEFATMQAPQPPVKPETTPVLQQIAIQVMESPEMAQDSEISMEERFYL